MAKIRTPPLLVVLLFSTTQTSASDTRKATCLSYKEGVIESCLEFESSDEMRHTLFKGQCDVLNSSEYKAGGLSAKFIEGKTCPAEGRTGVCDMKAMKITHYSSGPDIPRDYKAQMTRCVALSGTWSKDPQVKVDFAISKEDAQAKLAAELAKSLQLSLIHI